MKSFIKNKENFNCENCGVLIIGTGYTNHCHECFYSKHVDINPGDRAEKCGGLMKPQEIIGSSKDLNIIHQCTICNFMRKNKVQKNDNPEKIIELIQTLNSQK